VPLADDGMGTTMDEIFAKADAFLLGRTTYDIFSAIGPGSQISTILLPLEHIVNGLMA
jgi:hypothetical protein